MSKYEIIPQDESAPAHPTTIESTYQTCDEQLGKALFPTPAFYKAMLRLVFEAARLSKKGKYPALRFAQGSWDLIHALEKIGARVEVSGVENFKDLEKPIVFIANHMSTLETFTLNAFIGPHKPVTFVVKQELIDYPIFKHIMRTREPVVVSRKDPREDLKAVLEGGQDRLSRGISMIIFPQTTRSNTFDPSQFNSIGVKLAKRAGATVVPVALKTDAWANGKWLKDFGPFKPERTIHFAFGQPMEITGNGREQNEAIINFISQKLKAWKSE